MYTMDFLSEINNLILSYLSYNIVFLEILMTKRICKQWLINNCIFNNNIIYIIIYINIIIINNCIFTQF